VSTYQFRTGSRIKASLNAQAVGEELARLRGSGEGFTPEGVVRAARPKGSALHEHFSWGLTGDEAIQQVLEREASYLIRSVIRIEGEGRAAVLAPAFVSLITRAEGQREYVSSVRALTDEEYRAQVLGGAVDDFMALRNRYRQLDELSRIFEAIDATVEERALVAV